MEQKKFMDIARVKFGDELTASNIGGFEPGDNIQISEKIDGSNAAIRYNAESDSLAAFSRKLQLNFNNTLNGFWNYVQALNPSDFKDIPNIVIFGEWLTKHTIPYNNDAYNKWYVYDAYDVERGEYLPQSAVKKLTERFGFLYIHVLYEGPFVSWDHCNTFLHSPAYGDKQEGIVIKNQTKLNNPYSRTPFVLKIVNDSFSEIKKDNHIKKVEDPQKLKAREHAQEIVDKIVTSNRVEKEIYKMRDEGVLPEKIAPQDMKLVAMNLPKRIYDDCLKEEPELVMDAGEFFGKLSGTKSMFFARKIIMGA